MERIQESLFEGDVNSETPSAVPSPFEFVAVLEKVRTGTAGDPVLLMQITPDAILVVRVNDETSFRGGQLEGLKPGQVLKIKALFTGSGLLADEMEMEQTHECEQESAGAGCFCKQE